MIKIERLREKEKCPLCNKDSIYKLTFSTYDAGATIGSSIVLCKDCMKELKEAMSIDYRKSILVEKYVGFLMKTYNYSENKLKKIKDYAMKNFNTEHSIYTGEIKNQNCEVYINFEKEQILFYINDKLKHTDQYNLSENDEMFYSMNIKKIKNFLELIIENY